MARPGPIGLYNNPVIDPGTLDRCESPLPGPLGAQPMPAHRDEITPIAHYIAGEMNANAHGPDVKKMAEMNSFSTEECIRDFTNLPLWRQLLGLGITPEQCVDMTLSYRTAALLLWAMKVRQGGDWDHKTEISTRFHPRATREQHKHLYGDILYYYDIWSNLHYGYVGMAAGFSESMLLDGAGVEQIGSTIMKLKKPQKSVGISGMRAWDDPKDRVAIELGIRLYRQKPDRVNGEEIKRRVLLSTNFLNTKRYGS